jgi:DNA invertase Pin-like site-specific DNA recombinase
MRVATYLRVSTGEQTVENQRRELAAVIAARGWTLVREYADEGISGAKGRDKRPGFDAMLCDATRGEFQLLLTWSVDRLGRSLAGLLAGMQDLKDCGCALYLHKQGIDTSTASGRMLFQMLGVIAEFERSINAERTRAGIARARAQGKRIGRAPVSAATNEAIRRLRSQGMGIHAIRKALGVGASTVQKALI